MAKKNTKRILNNLSDCVDESLAGFVAVHTGIRLLKGPHRVLVRSDLEQYKQAGKVAILSGGGSGHEPAMAGMVGCGMAAGAVMGDLFASPGPTAILTAIRALGRDNTGGVLLMYNNYTGDRLNFGIAQERAIAEGIKVGHFINADDSAIIPGAASVGRRGLAGLVLITKIAGALAEEGKTMEEIINTIKKAALYMGTLGVCLSACSLPGSPQMFDVGQQDMELGLGLHGEAGVKTVKLMSSKDTVEMMVKHMTDPVNKACLDLKPGQRVAVLLNNLGSTTHLEMNILAHDTVRYIERLGCLVERVYVGQFCTSQEMAGFSLTMLFIDDSIANYLDAPCLVPGWVRPLLPEGTTCRKTAEAMDLSLEDPDKTRVTTKGQQLSQKATQVVENCLRLVCEELVKSEELFNNLDAGAGDGDCGRTLKLGALAIRQQLSDGTLTCSHPYTLLNQLAGIAEKAMGGSSGALYSLFFTAAAAHWLNESQSVLQSWFLSPQLGLKAVQKYGQAMPGDRTMVDPLHAFVDVVCNAEDSLEQSPLKVLKMATDKAKEAAEKTATMKAGVGRSSYVSADHLTQPDAGAMAVACWLKAVCDTCHKELNEK